MAPPVPRTSLGPDPRAAIQELIKGRDLAARLGALLRRGEGGAAGGQDKTGELADEVLMSFSRALSSLESADSSEAFRDPAVAGPSSLCSEDGKSEASTGKRKPRPAGDRRGGQRRRSHSYSWTVTSKTVDDGHTWRKYGQKEIHSAKFPRSYFRCTHKHDQGCQATRQVQKSEDDPSCFLITYMGHHTCMNSKKSPHPGASGEAGESFLISFGSDPLVGGIQDLPAPGAAFPTPKQECVDDDALSNLSRNDSSSEYPTLPALAALVPSVLAAASDVGESSGLHSSCVSPSSLDMDLGVESFRFEDVFNLDHDDFDF